MPFDGLRTQFLVGQRYIRKPRRALGALRLSSSTNRSLSEGIGERLNLESDVAQIRR